ncbi:MAG: hypothetical protein GQ525_08745 [Draconibacterium sp.]|nr:hypothetical protein [Draconibacterium sp.]
MKKLVVVLIHIGFWYMIGSIYGSVWEIGHIMAGGSSMWSLAFLQFFAVPLLLGGINFYLFYFFLTSKYLQKKKYLQFFGFGFISSLVSGIVAILMMDFIANGYKIYLSDFDSTIIFLHTQLAFVLGACGAILRVFFKWFSDLKYKQELEKKNLQTELALLKSQISPHFLFNTLNNIDVLITKDSEKASVYMKKLSAILRFMLYETKDELIPLNLEIEYIEKYIELQKIRTSNDSFVNFNIKGKADELNIAPMIFIPFIENAFKHTTNKKSIDAIKIRFDFSVDMIKFKCENLKNKSGGLVQKQSGLGINLIEQRLNLLYKDKHTLKIENSEEKYSVALTIQTNED